MAEKNGKTEEIQFGTWAAPAKENPYTEVVKQLAAAEPGPNGEEPSVTITVDAKEAANRQLAFQRAANDIEKTARLRHTDTSGSTIVGQTKKGRDVREGKITMTFTLSPKHKVRRGQNNGDSVEKSAE